MRITESGNFICLQIFRQLQYYQKHGDLQRHNLCNLGKTTNCTNVIMSVSATHSDRLRSLR